MRRVILFVVGLLLMRVALVAYACYKVAGEVDWREVFEQ